MTRLLIGFFFFSTLASAQDKVLAELLVGIGDSVKQLTLTPIEKYNKIKPFERSYISYSHGISLGDNENIPKGRIEFLHSIGFYLGIPTYLNNDVAANTTWEEIYSVESTAELQGLNFQNSRLIDSIIKSNTFDFGLVFAPISTHPLGKNIYLTIGVSSSRLSVFHAYTNNSLLDVNQDFSLLHRSQNLVGADFGLKYVLPYIQAGIGYKTGGLFPGVYANAGLNIPLKIILYQSKIGSDQPGYHGYQWKSPKKWKKDWKNRKNENNDKWKNLDKNAEDYKNSHT